LKPLGHWLKRTSNPSSNQFRWCNPLGADECLERRIVDEDHLIVADAGSDQAFSKRDADGVDA
jgi:hypothetical protein